MVSPIAATPIVRKNSVLQHEKEKNQHLRISEAANCREKKTGEELNAASVADGGIRRY